MRLLHSTTLEFRIFNEDRLPAYAILSHIWARDEVTYQEMSFLQKLARVPDELQQITLYVASLMAAAGLDFSNANVESIKGRRGYDKVEATAHLAQARGLDYSGSMPTAPTRTVVQSCKKQSTACMSSIASQFTVLYTSKITDSRLNLNGPTMFFSGCSNNSGGSHEGGPYKSLSPSSLWSFTTRIGTNSATRLMRSPKFRSSRPYLDTYLRLES